MKFARERRRDLDYPQPLPLELVRREVGQDRTERRVATPALHRNLHRGRRIVRVEICLGSHRRGNERLSNQRPAKDATGRLRNSGVSREMRIASSIDFRAEDNFIVADSRSEPRLVKVRNSRIHHGTARNAATHGAFHAHAEMN